MCISVFLLQIERGVVNLAGAKVQYSKDKQNAAVRNMGRVSDKLNMYH